MKLKILQSHINRASKDVSACPIAQAFLSAGVDAVKVYPEEATVEIAWPGARTFKSYPLPQEAVTFAEIYDKGGKALPFTLIIKT